jgi:hypothetical protein
MIVVMETAVPSGTVRTSADLIRSGELTREQAYAAALVLARLQDRGVGRRLTIADVCEVLGYLPERELECAPELVAVTT